jgi:hypothetical protein
MKLSYRTEQKYRVGQINWGESRPSHVNLTSDCRLRLISSFVLGSSQFVLLQGNICSAILCIIASHRYIEPLSIPAVLELLIAASTFAQDHTPPRNCEESQFARNARHKTYIVSPNSLCSFHVRLSTFESSPGSLFLPALRKIEHSAHYRR